MATAARPAAKPSVQSRVPLSKELVLRAAVALADEEGIEQLSMRRLAQQLGVEAMSLYHYFAKKDDLLAEMIDVVYSEMDKPDPKGAWRAELRKTALSAHHTLLRHAWACSLLMSPATPSTSRLTWMDAVLATLREAGFSPELIDHGYHALDSHIVGFTLWVLPYLAITAEQGPRFAQDFLTYEPIAQLPDLLDHIRWHLRPDDPNDTSNFDFALDLLLDGLERLRDSG
jgi:AcrR family transcriptional regulator